MLLNQDSTSWLPSQCPKPSSNYCVRIPWPCRCPFAQFPAQAVPSIARVPNPFRWPALYYPLQELPLVHWKCPQPWKVPVWNPPSQVLPLGNHSLPQPWNLPIWNCPSQLRPSLKLSLPLPWKSPSWKPPLQVSSSRWRVPLTRCPARYSPSKEKSRLHSLALPSSLPSLNCPQRQWESVRRAPVPWGTSLRKWPQQLKWSAYISPQPSRERSARRPRQKDLSAMGANLNCARQSRLSLRSCRICWASSLSPMSRISPSLSTALQSPSRLQMSHCPITTIFHAFPNPTQQYPNSTCTQTQEGKIRSGQLPFEVEDEDAEVAVHLAALSEGGSADVPHRCVALSGCLLQRLLDEGGGHLFDGMLLEELGCLLFSQLFPDASRSQKERFIVLLEGVDGDVRLGVEVGAGEEGERRLDVALARQAEGVVEFGVLEDEVSEGSGGFESALEEAGVALPADDHIFLKGKLRAQSCLLVGIVRVIFPVQFGDAHGLTRRDHYGQGVSQIGTVNFAPNYQRNQGAGAHPCRPSIAQLVGIAGRLSQFFFQSSKGPLNGLLHS